MIGTIKRLFPDTHPLRLLYHRWKAWLAVVIYGKPARSLHAICITGTDGKTTTVAMVTHILTKAGIKAGAVSSAFLLIGDERHPNPSQKTSPPPFALQKFLRTLVKKGCTHVVIESSSHGLIQGRLSGITPEVAAVTNLTMEHLDYHGTMEEYMHAKSLLFSSLRGRGTKVLNADDQTYATFKDIPSDRTLTYGTGTPEQSEPLSFQLENANGDASSSAATLVTHATTYELQLQIPGLFNLWNAACAIACVDAMGVDVQTAINAMRSFKGAPGRLEPIEEGQPFKVFIDFTVTPVAYERTLSCLKAMLPEGGRLLVLTGSCGDRMKEKRPIVGKICATFGDVVVVTNEDPYTEDPEKIIDEVLAGIPDDLPTLTEEEIRNPPHHAFVTRIADRLQAIQFLLRHAQPKDIVVFCGKGGDVTMSTNKGQIPWDEDQIVREELRKLNGGGASSSVSGERTR